jgi:hypothetical protein
MLFFNERLTQLMIAIGDMILLKNLSKMSQMFKRLMTQNQHLHPATLPNGTPTVKEGPVPRVNNCSNSADNNICLGIRP